VPTGVVAFMTLLLCTLTSTEANLQIMAFG
jgi:hypothetical protein